MAPLSAHSSFDYFGDDPEFEKALNDVNLDGDAHSDFTPTPDHGMPPASQPCLKRRRSPTPYDETQDATDLHSVLNSVDADPESAAYLSSHTYGASRFGEWGEYMSRKRAKLQIQNAEIDVDDGGRVPNSKIFSGLQIYINGWTEPSVQDLRQLIVRHGGIFHAYLDKKSLVTHIITCSLTPAKVREFKHMKVVRPEWLVHSAQQEALLPWRDFVFRPGERLEDPQGRQVAQKSLFDGFKTQDKYNRVGGSLAQSSEGHQQASTGRPRHTSHALQDVNVLRNAEAGPSTPPRTSNKPSAASPSRARPNFTTDPASPAQAARVPGYAAHTANPHAERAMADPAWRAAHTSVAPDFIEGYYKNSRLHHLSTWKAELRNLVVEAQERVENGGVAVTWARGDSETAVGKIVRENMDVNGVRSGADDVSMRGAMLAAKGKGKERERPATQEERVIMHCDFDSFFVSASLIDRPHLRGKPVVVCHSQGAQSGGASTSEIASASYEARKFGIKSGMSLQQARKLCPTVMTIPYEFQRYKKISLQFYTILMAHADDLQAVSVDEALIDVTSSVRRIQAEIALSLDPATSPPDPAKEFAEAIRAQVKKVTGCEVSVGIAHNIMLARVASRRAKPAGSFHIHPADAANVLAPLDIDDLHGFGYSARQKAEEKLGTANLGVLAQKSKATLCDALGKGSGETLYNAIRGIDEHKLESDKPRKSVSCDINYGIRFENNAQAETFIFQMAEEVCKRLNDIDMRGRSLTLKIMKRDPSAPIEAPKFMGHGLCETFNKQTPLIAPGGCATSDHRVIGEHAWRLLKSFSFDPKELRGIGIQIQKLEKAPVSTTTAEHGQAVLPFKPKLNGGGKDPGPAREEADNSQVVVQPPSQDSDVQIISPPRPKVESALDLPSFSQVDMSVFEALPDDVRKELETEYKRRSVTPGVGVAAAAPLRARVPSVPAEREPKKILVKGANLKGIARQLAPRHKVGLSSKKHVLFGEVPKLAAVSVSARELRTLDIDPAVFAELPVDIQREQLKMARGVKKPGAVLYSQHKVLKPRKRTSRKFPQAPAPKAVFRESPTLKQPGKVKGEKLYFSETDDIQQVIEAWVDRFKECPPNQQDVDFFAKFLVQCLDKTRSSDSGVEKAVAVAKWWLILLRRHFGVWEQAPGPEELPIDAGTTSELIGRTWWKAFREVKGKMDAVARKKFGGCLSLR